MNDLSWLIYLADVSDNVDTFLWLLMVLSVAGGLLWAVIGMGGDDFSGPEWAAWRRTGAFLLLPCFLLGLLVGSIVPAKDTVYAIAASEMGETVLKSETGNKAVGALNAWLDRQIAPGDKFVGPLGGGAEPLSSIQGDR